MQRYRVVILIVLFGILPVAAAFVFALFFLEEGEPPAEPAPAAEAAPPVEEAPPPAPEKPRVLAAVRTLPVGTLLRADDLTGVDLDLDPDAVRRGYVTVGEDRDDDAAAESLRGYAVREAIAAGYPLTRRAVVGPGQRGFLATVLEPGTRAVAIEVGSATSQAGLIDPGDRVDVILTAELTAPGRGSPESGPAGEAPGAVPAAALGGQAPGAVLARTIVEDARVVAINRTTRGVGGPPAYGEEEEIERGGIVTATLEVSPGEDDRLVLGGREGRLSLTIRSLHDDPPAGPGDPVAGRRPPRASADAVNLLEILHPLPDAPVRPPPPKGPTFDDMAALEDRMLTEFDSLEEALRAAMEAEAEAQEPPREPLQIVRIFRGSARAERVCFRAGKASGCPDREEVFDEGALPDPTPSSGLPLHDTERSPE